MLELSVRDGRFADRLGGCGVDGASAVDGDSKGRAIDRQIIWDGVGREAYQ